MSPPTLRPPNMPQQSPIHLPTPPPTSSLHTPLCAGPPEQSPPPLIPMREYDDVLLVQEAADDSRLQAKASRMWRESQEYSCAEDNETTPWLQHTRWPERFRNRPLDIITASSRLPARGCYEQNGDFTLGSWRGIPLRSSAAVEARIRVLMRAIDDMSGVSRNRPLRVMSSTLELGPRRLQEMYSMLLRSDDIKIMDHIVNLASQIVERGDDDDDDCEEDTETALKMTVIETATGTVITTATAKEIATAEYMTKAISGLWMKTEKARCVTMVKTQKMAMRRTMTRPSIFSVFLMAPASSYRRQSSNSR
ncbi:hypothetical protein H633G_10998 [Metarhizium anisopliae BRIP 53284]|nr:hypothetical protein H633G_10998 [Metarhizium anisopliae BRIP 53284]